MTGSGSSERTTRQSADHEVNGLSEVEIAIDVQPKVRPRRGRFQAWRAVIGVLAMAAAACAGLLFCWPVPSRDDSNAFPAPSAKQQIDEVIDGPSAYGLSGVKDQFRTARIADDGTSLWEAPGSADPLDLRYCPQGGQCFLVARPAELHQTPEGQRIFRALGPEWHALSQAWQSSTGIDIFDMRQVVVSWWLGREGGIESAVTVHLDAPLPNRWKRGGDASSNLSAPFKITGSQSIFVLIAEPTPPIIVFGSESLLKQIQSVSGHPPLLRREIEQLRQWTSSDRHLAILFSPSFIANDGSPMFSTVLAPVADFVRASLSEGSRAAALSVHLESSDVYCELRTSHTLESRGSGSQQLVDALQKLPRRAEDFLASEVAVDPYWKKLAVRLPAMLQFAVDRMRFDAKGEGHIVNVRLPAKAAHNLVLAGRLAFETRQQNAAEQ